MPVIVTLGNRCLQGRQEGDGGITNEFWFVFGLVEDRQLEEPVLGSVRELVPYFFVPYWGLSAPGVGFAAVGSDSYASDTVGVLF